MVEDHHDQQEQTDLNPTDNASKVYKSSTVSRNKIVQKVHILSTDFTILSEDRPFQFLQQA